MGRAQIVVVLVCCVTVVCCFNVDLVNYVRHRGDRDQEMFGFSVATHRDRTQTWVLVGAPRAQTDQPGVTRAGAVYRCRTDADGCQRLPFDYKGNNNNSRGLPMDRKSEQWFGAVVSNGGPDTPIVACAPRYIWFSVRENRMDPVGTCFVSKSDFTEVSEFSPCRTRHFGYHQQGTCQAGFSATISKDGERLYIGAPGSWYWQGQMYSIDAAVKLPRTPPKFSDFGQGQVFQQNIKKRPIVKSTPEGASFDDDSYLGYSVVVGDFTGDGVEGLAVGMPRAKKLHGKIVLYTWDLMNYQNLSGDQLGAYFGYALGSADIDGDNKDDLIVGAPLYTIPNNEDKYEVGRVYIIYQGNNEERFRRLHTLDGVNSKGRFGLSVASLGDIDLDGFDDIAIGAPYDGPNERGAVYIYYGSSDGIRKKASQVIRAEDVSQTAMYTFGFSISGNGIDLDDNRYPDMVVGAYLSNTAYVFKSRPVVKVQAYVQFSNRNKIINLEEKNCTLRNNERVSCSTIHACAMYDGIKVDEAIDLEVQFILDSRKEKEPRLFFIDYERRNSVNETWRLEKNLKKCKIFFIYVKEGARDKLTPLDAEMRFSLKEESEDVYAHHVSKRSTLYPVLSRNIPSTYKDTLVIRKNCGSDDICIPDLRLIVYPNVEKYLLGSNERLELDVLVQNEGEDSFESMFYMQLPPGINFFNTERESGIPVQCSANQKSNILKCDIGNPLPRGRVVRFKVLLDPFHKDGMKPSYDFFIVVNSTNTEKNNTLEDNTKHLAINIWVDTELSLSGWATSPDVHYNASHYMVENYTQESEIGPQIIHNFNIKNNGPSNINEAEAVFMWPYQTLGGDDLMYLMEQPEVDGPIKCEFAFANPLKLKLDRKKSYVESTSTELSGQGSIVIEEKTFGSSGGGSTHTSGSTFSTSYSETHSGSSSSGTSHKSEEDRKKFEDDLIINSGDASLIHSHRQKEGSGQGGGGVTKVVVGEDTGSGSKVTKQDKYYSKNWNSSSGYGGGPVVTNTWIRNTSWVTGPDGITTYTHTLTGKNGTTVTHTTTSQHGQGGAMYGQGGAMYGQGGQFSSTGHSGGSYNRTYGSTGQGSAMYRPVGGQSASTGHRESYNRTYSSTGGQGGAIHGSTGGHSTSTGHHESYNRTYSSTGQGGTIQGPIGGHAASTGHHESYNRTYSSTGGQGGAIHGSTGGHSGSTGHHESYNRTYSSTGGQGGAIHGSTGGHSASTGQGSAMYGPIGGGGTHVTHTQGSTTYGQGSVIHGGAGQIGGTAGHIETHSESYGEVHGFTGIHGAGDKNLFNWDENSRKNYGNRGQDAASYEESRKYENRVAGGQGGNVHHGSSYSWSGGSHGSGKAHSSHGSEAHGTTSVTNSGELSVAQIDRGHEGNRDQSQHYGHRVTGGSSGQGSHSTHTHNVNIASGSGEFSIDNIAAEGEVNPSLHDYARRRHHGSGRNRSTYGKYEPGYFDPDPAIGLGAAAIGSGFKTTALDLGTLSNANVDQDLSKHENYGGANVEYGSEEFYDEDLGSYERRNPHSEHGGVTYGSSRTYSGEQFEGHGGHGQGASGGSRTYTYSSSSSHSSHHGDNVPTEYPSTLDHRNRHYRRNKRQAEVSLLDNLGQFIQCNATKCKTLRCSIGPLVKNQEVSVALRFRANAKTLKKIGGKQEVTVSSIMMSRINKLPYIGTPNDRSIHTHEVNTTVTPTDQEIKDDIVPLWIVVLSACAGAIILLLLIFLLYKCGFFKRNRPSDAPERQPLNRNGHYHGDEQL